MALEKLFIYKGFMWAYHTRAGIDGPKCNDCRFSLVFQKNDQDWVLVCSECSKQFPLTENLERLKESALEKYKSHQLLKHEVVSFDLPPTKVGMEAEDEHYWINASIRQKNGKRVGIVYFGEKIEAQTSKDKTQLFIDFDAEQVRFDPNNQHPTYLLAKLKIEFPESVTTLEQKGEI